MVWWHMSLTSTLGDVETGRSLQVRGQPDSHSEFEGSQKYIPKPSIEPHFTPPKTSGEKKINFYAEKNALLYVINITILVAT